VSDQASGVGAGQGREKPICRGPTHCAFRILPRPWRQFAVFPVICGTGTGDPSRSSATDIRYISRTCEAKPRTPQRVGERFLQVEKLPRLGKDPVFARIIRSFGVSTASRTACPNELDQEPWKSFVFTA